MSTRNQGRLDGLMVDLYDGRFGGTFEMDTDVGEEIAHDDVVTFLVVAVAGKATFDTAKTGDLKRTNVFEVSEVNIVPQALAVKVANELGVMVNQVNGGQLTIDGPDVEQRFDPDDDDGDDYWDQVDNDPDIPTEIEPVFVPSPSSSMPIPDVPKDKAVFYEDPAAGGWN